ncbi:threonine/homoserine/homoserine lactone efflux protein [Pelomonas saccharophila]|uniref:Threonine/homoserine/homoserine lactone efflux protein n=1 Tax=Roseateles saccharophilus TaxID=304 RepID=A0ABU1YNQ8_ROSSA|nr:LysE family translocator [Roseateles saccharophilus]MDR7270496.1 threonine/homoserine/homoserine lactone efflux protein [Roseateles saccharophilus]
MNEMLPLLAYCALMSGTPGPNNMMLVANGAHYGYRRTLPAILGINTGGAVQTFVTCMGLGALFVAWPVLHEALKLAGTLYMLWLAWKLAVAPAASDRPPERLKFSQAALFQAVNPKSWVKAVTIASVFMPTQWSVASGALFVSAVGAVIGFPCISMWALFGVGIGRFLSSPARRRVFNTMMAVSLALLALLLLR